MPCLRAPASRVSAAECLFTPGVAAVRAASRLARATTTAREQGLALCEVCGGLGKVAASAHCPRCGSLLHGRRP